MEKFYLLTHQNHDAYFNLASEEFLLKHKEDYFIYLWINQPAVIVGVNQNTIEEVNLDYTEKEGIKVVRRLTGGGAVYHDENNICYTVIAPYIEGENNYKKFATPVIEYLNSLGIKAEFSGRNDITVDGKKISGNAQTVWKDRLMHHGTLLFSTNFDALSNSLKPNKFKIESKGIKSVRARVTNIGEYLKNTSCEEFYQGLINHLGGSLEKYDFSEDDLAKIQKLADEKYSKYEWNVGYSPKGKITFTERFSFGTLTINFDTEKGRIENASITGDFFSLKPISEFCQKLNGVEMKKEKVIECFSQIGEYILGANGLEIAEKLF